MKALVIGGATIDVITSIDRENIECITMRNATNSFLMMEQGKKVEARNIDNQIGGGASNAAVSMARQGAAVCCLLKLGTDLEATRVLERLDREHIDTRYVQKIPHEQTGKSIIVSSHDHNAGIFVHRGANTTLNIRDITPGMFDDMDLVYVSTLSSQSADAFPEIVQRAKTAGAFVACNPGIRQIRQRKAQVLDALKWVDLVAINKDEARALAEGFAPVNDGAEPEDDDRPELMIKGLGEKDAFISLANLAAKIHHLGCANLVVTNGGEGAYLAHEPSILFIPSVPCTVASTIGAGDAFNSTLALALAAGQSLQTGLSKAALNGASVAGRLDAQSGLLHQDELKARLADRGVPPIQSFPMTQKGDPK